MVYLGPKGTEPAPGALGSFGRADDTGFEQALQGARRHPSSRPRLGTEAATLRLAKAEGKRARKAARRQAEALHG